jgi:hypothetical protein
MSIGAGLTVIAIGAILTFAIPSSPRGLNVHVVGVILMVVGGVGLYLRMIGFRTAGENAVLRRWPLRPRTRIVEERVYDPTAEDPAVYRPADEPLPLHGENGSTVVPPVTGTPHHAVVREERRYEE